ncbi:hypothetical protein BC937DRAFT_87468 [Endogone sp. FLAS-F59071]|nr:hypothetical protein BC937DRAFT_87468 [Endogone sp. FLAS-F59071]|eukprot:RUS12587.1 hypothetical protein BC937DRAFT_87468 [Endogone sp. FLAS-F59071]
MDLHDFLAIGDWRLKGMQGVEILVSVCFVLQDLYHQCVNLNDFINEQLWSVTDPQQISALLSANEELTAALTRYRKSTEHEELVAATRAFERMKMEEERGVDGDDNEPIIAEEERLALKMKPVGLR